MQQKLQTLFKEKEGTVWDAKVKPLLMLFNRKRDIPGMLYHSWKYLSLLQDVFGIKDNQFTLKLEDGKVE